MSKRGRDELIINWMIELCVSVRECVCLATLERETKEEGTTGDAEEKRRRNFNPICDFK